MSEYQYELKKPFEYGYKGEMQTASFVTLTAPNFKQLAEVTPIKQALMSAISEVSSEVVAEGPETAPSESGDIDAKTVMMLLYRWSGDLTSVMRKAEKLFKSGAAKLDGETILTGALLEKMVLDDFEGMLGAYLANFIVPSLTDGL